MMFIDKEVRAEMSAMNEMGVRGIKIVTDLEEADRMEPIPEVYNSHECEILDKMASYLIDLDYKEKIGMLLEVKQSRASLIAQKFDALLRAKNKRQLIAAYAMFENDHEEIKALADSFFEIRERKLA